MKRLIAQLMCLLILLTLAVPHAAAAKLPERSEAFLPQTQYLLRCPGAALTVSGDGSFAFGEETVHFGYRTHLAAAERKTPYPVTEHTFSDGTLSYTLHLFLTAAESTPLLYARLTVENLTDTESPFPTVSPLLTPLTDAPGALPPRGDAACDYILSLTEEALPADPASYDDARAAMEAGFDALLSDVFRFTAVPEGAADYVTALSTGLVDLFCGGDASLSHLTGTLPDDLSALTCYDAALYYLQTEDAKFLETAWPALRAQADALLRSMQPYSSGDAQVRLVPGDDLFADNLSALLELKACAWLSRAAAPEEENTWLSAYQTLLSSVETVMRATVASCTSHWSAVTLPGDPDAGIFPLTADESGRAAAAWYRKDSVLFAPGGTYLRRLARAELVRLPQAPRWAPDAFVSAVVTLQEDGTVVLGQGLPGSWLTSGETIAFTGYPLPGEGTLDCTIESTGSEISVHLTPTAPTAVSLEIPALIDNIAYASCGFDSENGIVSVPAGVTDITVRLITDALTVTEEAQNAYLLEAAIAAAEAESLTGRTAYSLSLFTAALENARVARTGPASEQLRAASALRTATAGLADLHSGYTLSLAADAASTGTLTASEHCLRFTTGAAGTLTEVLLTCDDLPDLVGCIYTVQKDGFSEKELLDTAPGQTVEGGVCFSFSAPLEGETTYLFTVFSEAEDVSLPIFPAAEDSTLFYTADAVYDRATLGVTLRFSQADLSDLDVFLDKCVRTDTGGYTRESRQRLEKAIELGKALLCKRSVSEAEYTQVYEGLKSAYDSLATYPSDTPVEVSPMLYVVLGITVVLLVAGGVGAVASYKRRKW